MHFSSIGIDAHAVGGAGGAIERDAGFGVCTDVRDEDVVKEEGCAFEFGLPDDFKGSLSHKTSPIGGN